VNLTSILRAAAAAAIVATSGVAIPEASAQDPTTIQSGPVQAVAGSAQRIAMTMGKGQLFKTPVPYTKISVTDEKIVEVTPQSNREFVFTPKGVGSTNVLVFDEKNALIATLDINVESSVHEARREVHEETYGEIPGRVRIFNAPWRGGAGTSGGSSLTNPSYYHCTRSNCEFAGVASNGGRGLPGDAPNAGPAPAQAPATPQDHPPTDGEQPQ
jgi:Pilus formation protein N terminal region